MDILVFVEVLRALATLMILNSHCENVYPVELAIGGEYGLALFFLLTGYLLNNIAEDTRFIKWIAKKTLRIYIPLTLYNFTMLICGQYTLSNLWDGFTYFIYPTQRWFASFIIISYVLYFLYQKFVVLRYPDKRNTITLIMISALLVLYFGIYCSMDNNIGHNSTLTWHSRILWLICLLMGNYWRNLQPLVKKSISKHHNQILCLALAFMLLYGLEKMLYHLGKFYVVQFLCLFLPIISAIALFAYMESREDTICKIRNHPVAFKIVEWISKASFEIYIIQSPFINLFRELTFPINIIIIVVTSVMGGYILHLLSTKIVQMIYSDQ